MHPRRQLFGYFYSTVQYEIGTTPHAWRFFVAIPGDSNYNR
jgi:hypothetical protein